MQGVHLRKYGVEAKIDFELYEVDGVDFRTDWTPAAGDVFMMRDEAAEEQVTNASGNADLSTLITDEGRGYSITLALEDMQAARVVIYLVDQATKAFLDWPIIVETYGNASAQHAFDLDTAATAMRGTNSAALASICTEARLAALTDWVDGGRLDLLLDAIKVMTDAQRCVSGTVVVNNPGTDTIFDLTAVIGTLSTANDAYNNMQLTIYDVSAGTSETRKLEDYVGASTRGTVDEALSFPVEDGVDTFILWNKYSPTAAAGGGATAQEVHEYDVSGITTPGQAGYEIQQGGDPLGR